MKKGIWLALLAVLLTAVIIALPVVQSELVQKTTAVSSAVERSKVNIIDGSDKEPLKTRNGSGEIKDETLTLLVLLSEPPLIDKAAAAGRYRSVREFILSADGKTACDAVRKSQAVAKASIKKLVPEASLEGCRTLSALFNGVTVRAPAAAVEKLERIKGVSAVLAVKDDLEPFDNDDPAGAETAAAANARRLTQAQKSAAGLDDELTGQYGGSGMLIAVIDCGFDTGADVFSEYPADDGLSPSAVSELNKRISFGAAADGSTASVYLSPKIPFAYDYAGNDTDTSGEGALHGTAAASVAAGNNGEEADIPYRGIAFDAQLALMRVADVNGRIITAAFLAALDDAVKLGADAVNIGFGTYGQSEISELMGYAFEKMRDTGMTVTAAAGNGAYNGSYTAEKPAAADIFYSAQNALAQGGGVISAASMQSTVIVRRSVTINGVKLYYTDLADKRLTASARSVENIGTALGIAEHRAQYNEYVYAAVSGGKLSFAEISCKDRMLVTDASELTAEKLEALCGTAAEMGAVSLALTGLPAGSSFIDPKIPVVRLEGAGSSVFAEKREGTFTIDLDGEVTDKEQAPAVSDFSSYGLSDDLDPGAKLAAPGEDILAANDEGGFELISGTSAAVPVISGAYVVLRQYIKSAGASVSQREDSRLAAELMLSSAQPVVYGAAGKNTLYYSPRLQGFGALSVKNAVAARAHFHDASGLSAVKLGDSDENSFSFSFTLRNDADEARVFSLSCAVQTDKPGTDGSGRAVNTLEPLSLAGASEVTFRIDDNAVTETEIAAGASVEMTAEIILDENTVSELKKVFTAGFYTEGFVFAETDGFTLSLPFVGFCGSLDTAEIFDKTIYDTEPPVSGYESALAAAAYKNGLSAACGLVKYNDRLLFSSEAVRSSEDDTAYSAAVILPDLCTLCNAYDLTVRIYDQSEKLIFTEYMGVLSSHRYENGRPFERLSPGKSFRDLFAKLPNGRYRYEIGAKNMLSNGRLSPEKKISFVFEADNTVPDSVGSQTISENDRLYLELTAADGGGIRGFELYGAAYDSKNDVYSYIDSLESIIKAGYISESAFSLAEKRINDDGSFTFRYDITDLSGELKKLSVNTDTWQVKSLYRKIAYKAIDNAGNPSEVRLADAIEYGSAEFIFTDSSGRPVPNIGVMIGKSIIYSDKNGRAFFEKMEPNYYGAQLIYDKSLYGIDRSGFLVSITKDSLEYRTEQTVEFYGTYYEDSDGGDIAVEKTKADVFMEEQDKDEPAFAYAFVGSVLIVCVMLFILRKRQRAQELVTDNENR